MSTSAKKSSTTKPDAVKLLTADHREVNGLFKAYKKACKADAPADERDALAAQICDLLSVHTTLEEEIFYPAARAAEVDSALLDEAEVEHASAKELVAQLRGMRAEEALFDAKVTVLGEYVDHHVKEEEDELFPACKKAGLDMVELGAELTARKSELMAELEEEVV